MEQVQQAEQAVRNVVIVGGGSAGWLVACVLGSEFESDDGGVSITLIESSDVPTIGVGEGTWPSMRSTLLKIGIPEAEFIRECSASFKQGTRFDGWQHGSDDVYYHPFTLPEAYSEINLAEHWSALNQRSAFAQMVSPQVDVCAAHKAPKQIATPEYACNLNYGYHLDAGRFATLLRRHAVQRLGVHHIVDHVDAVIPHANGDIAAVHLRERGELAGDLFVDCSGFAALLLGNHYQIPLRSMGNVLFNDTALAVQVPHATPDAPIASTTIATACRAGWIWDIALPTRRGTGYVYAADFTSEDEALAELHAYLARTGAPVNPDDLTVRKIPLQPGYRERFWHRNCVAIGMSAGFVEPLEASALVLVELGARMLADELPPTRALMDRVARRFNAQFESRWSQVIEFLKLHYVLSQRDDTPYWTEHQRAESVPDGLAEALQAWRYRAPWHRDENRVDEMFPSASYQYILYGMGYPTQTPGARRRLAARDTAKAQALFGANADKARQMLTHLPDNRALIELVHERGFGAG